MSSQKPKDPRVAGRVVIDTIVTLIGFGIFFLICSPHVPSDDPVMINVWGAITASCMTGVFWMAWQMFRVTLRGYRDQLRSK